MDNREFWMRAVSPSFASKFGRELRFLKEPIMWYLATEHASGTCERTLSSTKEGGTGPLRTHHCLYLGRCNLSVSLSSSGSGLSRMST